MITRRNLILGAFSNIIEANSKTKQQALQRAIASINKLNAAGDKLVKEFNATHANIRDVDVKWDKEQLRKIANVHTALAAAYNNLERML